jgi:glycosyltransferase involved in cell wall biosynthesis
VSPGPEGRVALSDLLVVIPALNEAETVGRVIADVVAALGADVVVIDDGSTDDTARAARAAGAQVLSHPFNLGVGGAIRTGMRYASRQGYARVVQIDADGQHLPSEAARLLAELDEQHADLVIGSRFTTGYARSSAGYDVSMLRRLSMRLLSRLVSRRSRTRITDTTSGFRAFGPAAIKVLAPIYPSAYLSDTVETLLIAGDSGLRVVEIPVAMSQRLGGSPSSGHFRSLFHLIRVILVVLLHRVRRPVSQRGVQ